MAKTIPLAGGGHAIVDDEDFADVIRFKWKNRDGYACRANRKGSGLMHRLILGSLPGEIVDHINRQRADNRRSNLRIVTASQSTWNAGKRPGTSSKYKGVTWHKQVGKWQAKVTMPGGSSNYLGLFVNEDAAARAYDCVAREAFGGFGYLNFPEVL